MKWIFVTQISCPGLDRTGKALNTNTWCPNVMSWQYCQPHIFLFAQLSLTLLRAKNQLGTKRGVNLVIFSSHVAIIFIVDVPNFSLDWWNNIQLSCLALACWWMRVSNDPIASQHKPPPILPSLHLLHVTSTSLSLYLVSCLWLHHDGRGSDKISLLYPDH